MNAVLQHLVVLPIVVPLLCAAAHVVPAGSQRAARVTLALRSAVMQLAIAIALLYLTQRCRAFIWPDGIGVYAIGGWPAPFGIVLVVDRLSAVMLTLAAIGRVHRSLYASRAGIGRASRSTPLFQFLIMGLNGAFLTGDLFNLFVFVEVLLAASYGLLLHGVGAERVKAGLHYIVVNLRRLVAVPDWRRIDLRRYRHAQHGGSRGTAAARSGRRSCAVRYRRRDPRRRVPRKGGRWPLNFWLPGTYSVARAPVAAIFAMMTKVGVYSILRVGTSSRGRRDPHLAALFYLGLATLITGAIAILAAQHLARLVSILGVVSMGICSQPSACGSKR